MNPTAPPHARPALFTRHRSLFQKGNEPFILLPSFFKDPCIVYTYSYSQSFDIESILLSVDTFSAYPSPQPEPHTTPSPHLSSGVSSSASMHALLIPFSVASPTPPSCLGGRAAKSQGTGGIGRGGGEWWREGGKGKEGNGERDVKGRRMW